jgi:hypothetical protein
MLLSITPVTCRGVRGTGNGTNEGTGKEGTGRKKREGSNGKEETGRRPREGGNGEGTGMRNREGGNEKGGNGKEASRGEDEVDRRDEWEGGREGKGSHLIRQDNQKIAYRVHDALLFLRELSQNFVQLFGLILKRRVRIKKSEKIFWKETKFGDKRLP